MGKYQAYPEYKDSGVVWLGGIPSHWQLTRIKYIAELTPKKPNIERTLECSFVPMEKLKTNSVVLDEVRIVGDVYDGYTCFRDGDILMAKVTPCFENKNIAVVQGLVNSIGFGSSEIYVIRTNQQATNRYWYYRLQEDSFMDIATAAMTGAGGLKRVPSEVVNNFTAALPSEDELKTIANFLDHETEKIDTLIEQQQQLIQLLKEKRQAVISHVVTKGLSSLNGGPNVPMKDSGVEWLGEVPAHWDVIPLKLIIKTRKGVAFKSDDFVDEGTRVVKASDIKQLSINLSEVYLPKEFSEIYPKAVLNKGDIILSTVGSTPDVKNSAVGQIGMLPEHLDGSLLNQNTVVFELDSDGVNKMYLFYLLLSQAYRDHLDLNAHGTANQASLNIADMLAFPCPMPPKPEQEQIATMISETLGRLERLEVNAIDAIRLMQERRTALISAAVTGKIDVRNWQAPQQ